MKRQRLAVKEMSASHGTATESYPTNVGQRACDRNCGRCQACEDDFFFQQICDEVEGTYKDKPVQWSFGKTIFIEGYL
jgi:hypothetical protein